MPNRSDRRRLARAARLWHEQEAWRNATRASELFHVRADISERKWRLFSLECCRAILHLCAEPWHRKVVEQAEQVVDGPWAGSVCEKVSQLRSAHFRRRRWGNWDEWDGWYPQEQDSPGRPRHEVWAERALVDLGLWREGFESPQRIHLGLMEALATLPGFTYPADIFPSKRFYHEDLGEPSIVLSDRSKVSALDSPGIGVTPNPGRLAKQTLAKASL